MVSVSLISYFEEVKVTAEKLNGSNNLGTVWIL